MEKKLETKLHKLETLIASYKSALVAFSGGVDSSLLAYVCKKTLGKDVLLVTAISSTYPKNELEDARSFAALIELPLLEIMSEELGIPEFSSNPHNRCYHCKRELFGKLKTIASEKSISVIFDGNNASDADDFRPGRTAARESGIVSPLSETGLTKEDIRILSREFGLPTAEKPAMACLASRFPYGELITSEKLLRVRTAEQEIRELGFTQFRVRSHGDLARIEIIENEMDRAFSMRLKITDLLKRAGFVYQSIDLQGYRTGAMNEGLIKK